MNNAIEIVGLTKQYDDFTLKDLSFALPKGCIMGFIGENGAGKSTTIKLIMDLIRPDDGQITVLGQDSGSLDNATKEKIGVVMDESCFPENLSLKAIGGVMKHIYKTWNSAEFDRYAKKFELPSTKPVKDYSRGMKMKLSIAAALSHGTELLILDEATSGLDPIVRDEILDVFLEFIQNENHSILLSSHIISDLEKISDYITFIHKGKLIFSESKDDLLEGFALLKCSEQEFAELPKSAVKGYRKNSFGVEALVQKKQLSGNYNYDRATIEDIMLYHIKEGVR